MLELVATKLTALPRPSPMGALPRWLVGGGAHFHLTVRFAYMARSLGSNAMPLCLSDKRRLHFLLQQRPRLKNKEELEVAGIPRLFVCSLARLHHTSSRRVLRMPSCECFTFYDAAKPVLSSSVISKRYLRSPRNESASPPSKVSSPKRLVRARGGDGCLQVGDSKHINWWEEKMKQCQKASTRELIKRLASDNILGLDTSLKHGSLKQGSFNRELLETKRRFPHEVILRRVGDFYESCGFDACVLVEYAGLNPMGGTFNITSVPRAGCPTENLRQTLDSLTSNGFSVCIVEEVKGPSNAKKRKERFISGHAHPGSPYVYGLAEADFDVDFPDPVSTIGIARSSASGYSMISIVELMRTKSVVKHLTEEATVAKLRATPFQGLFLHKSLRAKSTGARRWGEFGEGGLLWAECRSHNPEWYDFDEVSELESKVKEIYNLDAETEFRFIDSPPGERPRPLNVGTASHVGILPTQGVPSLLRALLPLDVNGLCAAYLRDLLLNPPPVSVASSIKRALHMMGELDRAIPNFECVSAAKLVKLIGAQEANHLEFARIRNMAEDVLLMERDWQLGPVLEQLLLPTWLATGLHLDRSHLVEDCEYLVRRLDEVLAPAGDPHNAISSSKFVSEDFFFDMEVHWKQRVRRDTVEEAYAEVDRAATSLSDVIERDLQPIVQRTRALAAPVGGGSGGATGEVSYSPANKAVWFRGKRFRPTLWSGGPGEDEIKALKDAKDAKGKKVGEDWFTTDRVEIALEGYRAAVENASSAVILVLRGMAGELQSKLNSIVFLATISIVAQTLFAHVKEAKRRRWVLPLFNEAGLQDFHDSRSTLECEEQGAKSVNHDVQRNARSRHIHLENMFPYWLDKTQDHVVLNTVQLSSMFLLTGPNGGGKSSVLRSICAATLLATCGLMVPCTKAVVPKLDSIMLRMMIADSPADCKSSFQMEMSELRTILSDASEKSLVLVDELCKGTEVNKGTCIVGSVLEHLDRVGCLGVMSTHLHGLLDMDLDVRTLVNKAMEVEVKNGRSRPTWRLVDGVCRESLAFETARKEGVPESVLQRAEEFYNEWAKAGGPSAHKLSTLTNVNTSALSGADRGEEKNAVVNTTSILSHSEEGVLPTESPTPPATDNFNSVDFIVHLPDNDDSNDFQIPSVVDSYDHHPPLQERQHSNGFVDGLEDVFVRICRNKLSEMRGMDRHCQCFAIGAREAPPPMTTNVSCVYILQRPDGKLYVGQTTNLSARIRTHRGTTGLQSAPFLYVPVHNTSVACELETTLIKQLPGYGFSLVNRGDQNHRHFGTEPLLNVIGDDNAPF